MEIQLKSIFNENAYSNNEIKELVRRGYVWPNNNKGKILFIGMNPSYPIGSNPRSFHYEVANAVKDYPSHFKNFDDLVFELNQENKEWNYLDLFYFQETNQKKVFEIIKSAKSADLSFITDQLKVSQSKIEESKPDIIIVCNSGARTFLGIEKEQKTNGEFGNVWMGYDFEFDSEIGTERIIGIHQGSISGNPTNLINTPVLFTSTLKYMDRSSKKRLGWHINFILHKSRNI